jgi:hypothetical protein
MQVIVNFNSSNFKSNIGVCQGDTIFQQCNACLVTCRFIPAPETLQPIEAGGLAPHINQRDKNDVSLTLQLVHQLGAGQLCLPFKMDSSLYDFPS